MVTQGDSFTVTPGGSNTVTYGDSITYHPVAEIE